MKSQVGFTLIELSIVLVIIGLVVGGVLVGRDLIHVAELRSTITQLQKFDTAMNTFRLKYNCLAGDCANASDYGFTGYNGGSGNGNGNGYIDFYPPLMDSNERFNALYILSQANLLAPVQKSTDGYARPTLYTTVTASSVAGVRAGIAVWFMENITGGLVTIAGNYYWLGAEDVINSLERLPAFLPIDAYALDSKIDDGLPESGKMLATGSELFVPDPNEGGFFIPAFSVGDTGAAGANSHYCVTNATPNQYNLLDTSRISGSLCTLVLKAAF